MRLLLFYRQGIIKLICDQDQNPGKPDPFVEEKVTDEMSKYVSAMKAMHVDLHCVFVSYMGLFQHELMLFIVSIAK